jgi:lysophospholipase L1-like esterase
LDWYEAEVAALESARKETPPALHSVVFYGSSSIRLWATLTEDFPDLPVVNAGFGGSTLTACAWFFERLVVPLQPGALVLYAGDNDLGDGRPPVEVVESLRALLEKFDRYCHGIPLVFLSIKPSPCRWHLRDRIRATNELAREVLAQRRDSHFLDVFEAMLGPDGLPRGELFAEDGLHRRAAGYELWRAILSRHRRLLVPLVESVGPPKDAVRAAVEEGPNGKE